MSAFTLELQTAARRLIRRPGLALFAITSIALGVGANTAVFSLLEAVILRPLPLAELERLMAPALVALRAAPRALVAGGAGAALRRPQLRLIEAVAVGETAVALILVFAAGLLGQSLARLVDEDPGFRPENVLVELEALPGVAAVGYVSQIPFGGNYDFQGLEIEGRPEFSGSSAFMAERYGVTADYFAAIGLEPVAGRLFDARDREDGAKVVVVDQAFADKIWPGADPLGRRVRTGADAPWRTVVGVVPSVREYFLDGQAVHQLGNTKRQEIGRRKVGFVFQHFHLLDDLTVAENLEIPLSYRELKKSERQARVADILDRFQIVGKKDLFPRQLSGGQQQLVGIARALIIEPEILLADEPTGNLHSAQGREIMACFQALNRQGKTIIQVTHSEDNAAFGRRIVHLRDGWLEIPR